MPVDLQHRPEIIERLQSAQADLAAKLGAVETAREVRDRLIEEAVDVAGLSQREVARAAGLTQSSVVRILGHG